MDTVRQQAEDAFTSYKETHPDALLLGLIRVLREDSDVSLRQQAAVAIRTGFRNFLVYRIDTSWSRLNVDTKQIVRTELLNSLETETNKTVRRSVCDTVADLGAKLTVTGEWPELNGRLIAFVESQDTGCQAAGLKVLAELVPQISDVLRSNVGGVQRMITTCAKSQDPKVRYECFCLVTALVEIETRNVWKRFQNTLPDFIEALQALVQTNQCELAKEFLMKFGEIANGSSVFFKPHMTVLVQTFFSIAQKPETDDEIKQLVVQVFLCMAEDKPQMCMKIPNFVSELVRTLLELMLTVGEDAEWIDHDNDQTDATVDGDAYESTRNYDVGESGLDQLAAALGGENIMNVVFNYVAMYLRKTEWHYKLVGIMAISQTAEYIPEDGIEAHLDEIVNILLAQLKDGHPRVRFAACQAIGQISLDHQPLFQKNYANMILPALIATMDDTTVRVQSHAISALINFVEEVEKPDLMPFADTLMQKLFQYVASDAPRMLRALSITGIAVVAGVLEKSFLKYYPVVIPVTKEVILKCTTKEERTIRARAAECFSIIGLSVGAEIFEADAHEIMHVLLQIPTEVMEGDDITKEYIQESFCRICRTLKGNFLPYIQHLMPAVLKALNVTPEIVSDGNPDDMKDMTIVSITGEKYSGLKTSVIEEMIHSLDLLPTFIEILGAKFGDFLLPTAQSLLPLLDFTLSDDVKRSALAAMAEVFNASREMNLDRSIVQGWVGEVLTKVFKSLSRGDDEDGEIPDIDMMVAETDGLAKCLRNAGHHVLTDVQVNGVCSKVFHLMKDSAQRRAELQIRKQDPDYDEEDIDSLDEEESEQTLRTTLLEIIAAIMCYHPELYLQHGAALCQQFIDTYLAPQCTPDDRALALYVCDDVLEHLKDMGAPLWPTFAERLIGSILDKNSHVRQAASFGMIQAAKCSQFPTELIQRAATHIVSVLNDGHSKDKAQLSATDNAIAALGSIVLNRGAQLQPSPEQYLKLWIDHLPLKVDHEEGRRTHQDLVELLVKRNPDVLGAHNSNLPKLASICASIYRTEFSTNEIDEGIRKFIEMTGFDVIQTVGAGFDKKLQQGLERIHRDVMTTATPSKDL